MKDKKRFAFPVSELVRFKQDGSSESVGMKLRWNTGWVEDVWFDGFRFSEGESYIEVPIGRPPPLGGVGAISAGPVQGRA